jgi:4-amino-4-deoxychorismate lyase
MSKALEIHVDGIACNEGWPQDRSLQYGDGLFETMLVRKGRIRFESLHAERLARGCSRLAINADHESIWSQARVLAHRHEAAMLKLQLTRGDATARGYGPSGAEHPRLILSVFPAPLAAELPVEIQAVTSAHCLGENPDLAGIKHCSRLEQVLARARLKDTGSFEGLMGSSSGLLISGTMSNVFMELEGELVTPVLNRCGIEGVMRAVVLREAARSGAAVRVADFPLSALARCTGLAISNVRLGLLPVHRLDGRNVHCSERVQKLAARIEAIEE